MIVFCEDCGKKNLVSPDPSTDQASGRRIKFQCAACGYSNTSPLLPYGGGNPDKIKAELKRMIRAHTPILGAFIFHYQKKIIIGQMPGRLEQADMEILGRILSDTYLEGKNRFPDIEAVCVCIGEKIVTVLMNHTYCSLVVVTERSELSKKLILQFSRLLAAMDL